MIETINECKCRTNEQKHRKFYYVELWSLFDSYGEEKKTLHINTTNSLKELLSSFWIILNRKYNTRIYTNMLYDYFKEKLTHKSKDLVLNWNNYFELFNYMMHNNIPDRQKWFDLFLESYTYQVMTFNLDTTHGLKEFFDNDFKLTLDYLKKYTESQNYPDEVFIYMLKNNILNRNEFLDLIYKHRNIRYKRIYGMSYNRQVDWKTGLGTKMPKMNVNFD